MQLRNVEMFCGAVELRSFSRAAEHMHVSQSAISQAIQQLEKRVGTPLIDRSKRPFELTQAGTMYFQGCRDLLTSFRSVEDKVREMENKVTGRIRVAAIYSVGLMQINELITQFMTDYPDVQIDIDYVHPEEVYHRVSQERDDLGLVSFPKTRGEFTCLHWQNQKMVCVVGRQHPWVNKTCIEPDELQGVRFVGYEQALSIRKQIDRWFRERGISVNRFHEFDNIECIKRDVESSAAVAILPQPTITDECASGRLHAIEIAGVDWTRPLGIIHRKGRELTRATLKFIEVLRLQG